MAFGGKQAPEPVVPRWIYEQKCADYDALLEKYHALRQQGHTPRAAAPPVQPPPVEPEHALLQQAERDFMARATQDFIRQGRSEAEAREIAQHLARAVTQSSPVPTL